MTLLILGILLWTFGHLARRLLPGLYDRIGPASKGVSALLILAALP